MPAGNSVINQPLQIPPMKMISIVLFSGFLLVCLSGCYYDKEELLYPSACDSSNVTYALTIEPIINTNCLSCHDSKSSGASGGAISLEGYQNVLAQVQSGALLKVIKHESGVSPMPKNQSKLSDCNISKIETWINSGAPNN